MWGSPYVEVFSLGLVLIESERVWPVKVALWWAADKIRRPPEKGREHTYEHPRACPTCVLVLFLGIHSRSWRLQGSRNQA